MNQGDQQGKTLLWYAAKDGGIRILELFLDSEYINRKLRLDYRRHARWQTAILMRNRTIVSQLICIPEVGLTGLTNFTETTLSLTLQSGQFLVAVDIVGHISDDSIVPERKDKYGRTSLSVAAASGRTGDMKNILKSNNRKLDVKSRCFGGRTSLSYAAGTGSREAIQIMLEEQGNIWNEKDNRGLSPLNYCEMLQNGDPGALELLQRTFVPKINDLGITTE